MSHTELVNSLKEAAEHYISKRLQQDILERNPIIMVETPAEPEFTLEELIAEDFLPGLTYQQRKKERRRLKNIVPGCEGRCARPDPAVRDRIMVHLKVWEKGVDFDELNFSHSSSCISQLAAELEARKKAEENGFGVYRVERFERISYLL